MPQPGMLATIETATAPALLWVAPPGARSATVTRWIGASTFGSAILLLVVAAGAGDIERIWPLAALLSALAGLLFMVCARSAWLRRPALCLLVALAVIALVGAVIAAAVLFLLAAVALMKLLIILVAHGVGFGWSWGSGDSESDSDSDSESGDSSADSETESDDLNSDSGFRAALNRLPGVHLGMGGAARNDPTSCPGCGRGAGTGPERLCRSCSW